MAKRSHEEDASSEGPLKRIRAAPPDRISSLSDELLLRILSNLSVTTLNLCQGTSRRFHALAADSQLWKAAYYNRFVRPRAARIPGVRDGVADHLIFSSKSAKWLDEESFVKKGREMNWKRQYKIRHNWSRGRCGVSEIQVADCPPIPQLLVRYHEGIVFTVDSEHGLRAWSSRNEQKLLAHTPLPFSDQGGRAIAPTSLAIDSRSAENRVHRVAIGFEDGTLSVLELQMKSKDFLHLYKNTSSSSGMVSAIALASPYLLVMTEKQQLSLYKFEESGTSPNRNLDLAKLLISFKSHTSWPPLTLSIKPSVQGLVASIAYALPTYLTGWSVGVQEVRLSLDGRLLDSRVATALDPTFHSRSGGASEAWHNDEDSSPPPIFAKPSSLSYSHPYLLVSHPDNTLTLYLVSSTETTLSVSAGKRLWGHTSSVSGAEVGGRGKAVSVSSRGNELRVWELEGGLASAALRRRLATGALSVKVSPDHSSAYSCGVEATLTKGWVGFDDENVVVLREKSQGQQALVVYDFT
ncbi:MAG: hypothetical protein Q9165_000032 [Trypethelium subeluteriae]